MKIQTIHDLHGVGVDEFAKCVIRSRRQGVAISKEMADMIIKAEINRGRWLANCPWCGGAEMVDPDNPKFLCLSCFNAEILFCQRGIIL